MESHHSSAGGNGAVMHARWARAHWPEHDAPVCAPILAIFICTHNHRTAVRMRASSTAVMPRRMIVQLRNMLFSACAVAKCDKT
ncbi:TPA: hypothetical protein HH295_11560 [Xanthomonas vasicola pv. zeae]|uniref:Uncharacterized protein n=1 Tax=Xanthomonas vasicola pv. vasculorum TaxID=325776 RepID=A0AAE8F5J6_XANVA|nr:hypothetical protein [Xanthomonas vasicola]KEZ97185.1 lipoprotein [Xanthomonas vasicola pv. vasculorum NCPPB 895]HHZ24375.1 hypothetical protein [Xanthomonas vasicola pv. zeae]AVQ06814.1 hypothetical protein C7V42_09530 [Xanthomonas vasicola pv. vasculorum]AZM71017.1 hypothetical protein CXP37_09545 [Xanthomonas vasicola pv. vasculorum]MBV7304885.1 hypothetical protein [Xanthomonas vasicola pv. vasculorum]